MNPNSRPAPSINGHMIDLDAGHSIALYERNGVCWVAQFRDGRGEFTYASTWFGGYAGGLWSCHHRRASLESSRPLNTAMLAKIERLHAESEARQERLLALPRQFVSTVKRCVLRLKSWSRGVASKTTQTVT